LRHDGDPRECSGFDVIMDRAERRMIGIKDQLRNLARKQFDYIVLAAGNIFGAFNSTRHRPCTATSASLM
jgi:hypothetical protein